LNEPRDFRFWRILLQKSVDGVCEQ
jgi:hypothetical protein